MYLIKSGCHWLIWSMNSMNAILFCYHSKWALFNAYNILIPVAGNYTQIYESKTLLNREYWNNFENGAIKELMFDIEMVVIYLIEVIISESKC